MIRHLVLLCVKPAKAAQPLADAFRALQALRHEVAGIVDIACGADVSPEGMARGYTHAFTVDFVDEAARDAYLVHPQHRAVGAALIEIVEGGLDGLCVIDFDVGAF